MDIASQYDHYRDEQEYQAMIDESIQSLYDVLSEDELAYLQYFLDKIIELWREAEHDHIF